MAEKLLIIDNLTLTHSGLFSSKEIERFITGSLQKKGYDLKEQNHDIIADPQNKKHTIALEYAKMTAEFDKSIVKVSLVVKNITKIPAKINGMKQMCEKGDITIAFTAVTKSGKEGFYGYTPWRHFFTYIRTKFITTKFDHPAGEGLVDDVKNTYDELYLYVKHTEWDEVEPSEEKKP